MGYTFGVRRPAPAGFLVYGDPMDTTNALSPLGMKIYLDRYSTKDSKRETLQIDDTVIVIMPDGRREIGQIKKIETPSEGLRQIVVEVGEQRVKVSEEYIDKPLEPDPSQMMNRVARGAAEGETDRAYWTDRFRWLLDDWKFVPGGRILTQTGSDQNLTIYNCVSGETLIHTDKGLQAARELVGKTVNVLSKGGVYRPAKWDSYGQQLLYEITMQNGDTLFATGDHEWVVQDKTERVKTIDLQGHRIPIQHLKDIVIKDRQLWLEGVRHGFAFGDGTTFKGVVHVPAFVEDKQAIVKEYFDHVTYQPSRSAYVANRLPVEFKSLPYNDSPTDYKIGFIAGLIAADGHVDKYGTVVLHQKDLQTLITIRQLCASVGLPIVSIKQTRDVNPFNGQPSTMYAMRFVKAGFYTDQGINSDLILRETHRKHESRGNIKTQNAGVLSVKPTQRYEEVYCCIEPETHTMVIEGGYLTGQCYAISSPKDSRGGIMDSIKEMAEIMSHGGGVGVNISSIRPRHAYVRGVNGRSSGAPSWGGGYSYFTGLIEQAGCVTAETRIQTDQGLLPIGEIVERVERGEKLQAWTHKGYRPITDKFRNGVKPVYRVQTTLGYSVEITEEHPLMTIDKTGQFIFKKVEALETDDAVLLVLGNANYDIPQVVLTEYPYDQTRYPAVNLPTVMDEKLAFVLGYFMGNGYIAEHTSKALSFAVPDNRPETLDRLTTYLHELFNIPIHTYEGDGACKNVVIMSRPLVAWWRKNGWDKAGAINTFVPEIIYRSPRSVIEAFIGGWFAADGKNQGRKGGLSISSISYRAVTELQQLLLYLGIPSRISTQRRSNQNWNTLYSVGVNGAWACLKMAVWLGEYSEKIKDHPLPRKNHAFAFSHNYRDQYYPHLGKDVNRRMVHGNRHTSQHAVNLIRDHLVTLDGEVENHAAILAGCVEDRIVSIEYLRDEETYDITVDELHLVGFNGVYGQQSRRGALMLIINDWHPDVLEFINMKRDMGTATNANISVGLSDAFMQAVEQDGEWTLCFPDTSHPDYDALWDGDLEAWIGRGLPVHTYKTMRARAIWAQIIEAAHASAEPGLWFRDRSNHMSNSWYYSEGKLIVTNPCGEQPLPANGVCLLGSLNLPRFYDPISGQVKLRELEEATAYAVRFLDNIIDVSPYIDPNKEWQQKGERRMGLGTMGLAELMIRCGVRYGSQASLDFIDQIYSVITYTAYRTSIQLAREKGAFKWFDAEKYLQSGFVQTLPPDIRQGIVQWGIRNVTLLTQAPTGSTGTMMNTSTGIEPYFALSWIRKSRLGEHQEHAQVLKDWLDAHPGEAIPDYFVTAMDLTPEDHVRVQAHIQQWIDSAISKTCNVPQEWTPDQVGQLYQLMHQLGCKGGTVYRDGSRDVQVLNVDRKPEHPVDTNHVQPRPQVTTGITGSIDTMHGKMYVNITTLNDQPFEVFITASKAGSDIQADAEAMGRLISLMLRSTHPDQRGEMYSRIIDQLLGIQGSSPHGMGARRVLSLPDAVAKIMQQHLHQDVEVEEVVSVPTLKGAQSCPGCGNFTLIAEEGCWHCNECGYNVCK